MKKIGIILAAMLGITLAVPAGTASAGGYSLYNSCAEIRGSSVSYQDTNLRPNWVNCGYIATNVGKVLPTSSSPVRVKKNGQSWSTCYRTSVALTVDSVAWRVSSC